MEKRRHTACIRVDRKKSLVSSIILPNSCSFVMLDATLRIWAATMGLRVALGCGDCLYDPVRITGSWIDHR